MADGVGDENAYATVDQTPADVWPHLLARYRVDVAPPGRVIAVSLAAAEAAAASTALPAELAAALLPRPTDTEMVRALATPAFPWTGDLPHPHTFEPEDVNMVSGAAGAGGEGGGGGGARAAVGEDVAGLDEASRIRAAARDAARRASDALASKVVEEEHGAPRSADAGGLPHEGNTGVGGDRRTGAISASEVISLSAVMFCCMLVLLCAFKVRPGSTSRYRRVRAAQIAKQV
jgi:hypothetical protein